MSEGIMAVMAAVGTAVALLCMIFAGMEQNLQRKERLQRRLAERARDAVEKECWKYEIKIEDLEKQMKKERWKNEIKIKDLERQLEKEREKNEEKRI